MTDLFRRLYLVMAAGLSVYAAYMIAQSSEWNRMVAPMLIILVSVVASLLQHQGRKQAAFLTFAWGAVTLQAFMRVGVHSPALYAYAPLALLGGWLLGLRQAVLLTFASIVAAFCIAYAQHRGLVDIPASPSPLTYWLAIAVVLLLALLVLRLILRSHWQGIEGIQALNRQLEATILALKAHEDELRRSEQRFAKVSQASPLPIVVSELDSGCCLEVNPAWEHCFHRPRDQAVGRQSVDLGLWCGERQRDDWVSAMRREGRTLNWEINARSADGKDLVLLTSSEMIDYDGMPAVLSIMVDVTERRRVQDELVELNAQLEQRVAVRTRELSETVDRLDATLRNLEATQKHLVQSEKLAAMGKLVAGVAHELNTPIGNALTSATTLVDLAQAFEAQLNAGPLKRSELKQFLAQCKEGATLVERSLGRAGDLVTSFKQVAIDQASEWRRQFDLREVVLEVIDTLRPNLRQYPYRIDVDIPPGITMESYPGPLGQIVINLVMNAVLHAFDGRNHGTVRLSGFTRDPGRVTLVFEDDGHGIPTADLGRIFDPFFTTKLGQGGSGLGLSITHRLATQVLGGAISVDSSAAGTTFRLDLPLLATEGS